MFRARMFWAKHISSVKRVEPSRDWDWEWEFETCSRCETLELFVEYRELSLAINRRVVRPLDSNGLPNIIPVVDVDNCRVSVCGRGKPMSRWEIFRVTRILNGYLTGNN